jgi:hypothetical protein
MAGSSGGGVALSLELGEVGGRLLHRHEEWPPAADGTSEEVVSDLVEVLKKYVPTALRVELTNGTLRTVPMAKAGNKWSRAVKILDALDWVKVECLDGKGGVLGVVEADLEVDDEPAMDAGSASLAKVMLEVMRSTMREFRSTFGEQLKGMAELQKALTDGLSTVTESYQTAMRVQAAHLTSATSEGGNEEVMRMLTMAMALANNKPRMPGATAEGGHGG